MRAYVILALLAIASCYSDEAAFTLFQAFVKKYEKQYSTMEEFMHRFTSFRKNLNRNFINTRDWQEGISKFFDYTPEEFKAKYLNFKPIIKYGKPGHFPKQENPPTEFNWVDKGVLPPVKDQRSCGSCWAFATCANLEGCWNNKKKKDPIETCSEQMLVDCDTYDEGCGGGDFDPAMKWIIENGGMMHEEDYPYKAYEQECQQDKSKLSFKGLKEFLFLENEDEEEIQDWILANGPIAIGLNANMMQFYLGGIIDPSSPIMCSPEAIDHGISFVGYGEQNGKKFWIGRNSWGKSWGESGYFKIVRGKGACGLNKMVYTMVVEE